MICPECNTHNRDGAAYCLHCGSSLAPVCPQCGWELLTGARFCDRCGARQPAVTSGAVMGPASAAEALRRLAPKAYADRLLAAGGKMVGERRMVTILMSDVKGSSSLSRDLDPEEWLEIMGGAFEVLIAPIAHEDDPERACRAGLDIVEGAAAYRVRLEKERGVTGFNVRVGIHSGLVVVGEVGNDLRMEYTAMGVAPNLTARLEGAAEPGTVLVSETTHLSRAPSRRASLPRSA
jgi:class 3 adenylate cyclase